MLIVRVNHQPSLLVNVIASLYMHKRHVVKELDYERGRNLGVQVMSFVVQNVFIMAIRPEFTSHLGLSSCDHLGSGFIIFMKFF